MFQKCALGTALWPEGVQVLAVCQTNQWFVRRSICYVELQQSDFKFEDGSAIVAYMYHHGPEQEALVKANVSDAGLH